MYSEHNENKIICDDLLPKCYCSL